ncbi:MAG: transporter [Nitrosomonadales bacterium]|nr:transporter [Nitrosomonadales bacterium]
MTPYRPTVSNQAALSAPGWIELEAGLSRQLGGVNASSQSLPYLLKFALSEDFGVLLGGDAWMQQTAWDGGRLSGAGDTTLLLKNRWELNDREALGLEYGFKAATASKGLGSGKTDYVVNGIYSLEDRGDAIDLNLNLTGLGDAQAGRSDRQWGGAVSWSRQLDARWAFSTELSGTWLQRTAPVNQWLLATSYTLSERVVLDAGVAAGLSRAAKDWEMFAGFAVLLERVR